MTQRKTRTNHPVEFVVVGTPHPFRRVVLENAADHSPNLVAVFGMDISVAHLAPRALVDFQARRTLGVIVAVLELDVAHVRRMGRRGVMEDTPKNVRPGGCAASEACRCSDHCSRPKIQNEKQTVWVRTTLCAAETSARHTDTRRLAGRSLQLGTITRTSACQTQAIQVNARYCPGAEE